MDPDTLAAAQILDGTESSEQRSPAAIFLAEEAKKLDALKTASGAIRETRNIRNMIIALAPDIRVIIITLAHKLSALYAEKQKTAARECLEIYAPLADRLGISRIKNEMEDIALQLLNRDAYLQIQDMIAEKRGDILESAQKIVRSEAESAGLTVDVHSREKHFYSVYMKMRKRGKSAHEIHDLSGMRILCETTEHCYTLLGLVHRLWKPLDNCFKDYIAMPKANGYQSLHTTVTVEDSLLEIQIRTREMHHIAENGIASHWLYKQGASNVKAEDIDIANKLRDWKQGEQWLEETKQEIFSRYVYVFTPQGKVIELPAGSTPVDFAYYVHTAVGDRCIGAKANGSIIQLSSELCNTQTVEILTSAAARPHYNWLSFVKTSKARAKIRSWLEKNDASFASEKHAEKKKTLPDPAEIPPPAAAAPAQMHIRPLESVLQVRIEDEKNMMIRFARCCSPVTGDSIIGYVSRGRGIIIHRDNCPSLAGNPEFEKRKIAAAWENAGSALVKRLRIEAKYSAHLFSEIEGAIRSRQGHLIEGRLEETAANRLSGIFAMQLMRPDDVKPVMKNIRGVPGILNIQLLN